jgi:hypothetical protein
VLFTVFGILSFIAASGSSAPGAHAQASRITNDIGITMTASRAFLRPGNRVLLTVRMTNHGPDNATFVDLGFRLPARLKPLSLACARGISPDGLFCEYASLPIGATVISRLVAVARPGLQGKLVRVFAAVSFENAGILDPNLRNNTASVRIWVTKSMP